MVSQVSESTTSQPEFVRPLSVVRVVRLLWALVVLSGLATLCAVIFRDELVLAWAEDNEQARQLVEQGGLAALEQSSVSIPAFGQLAVVMFGVLALLTWMLGAFFCIGQKWARLCLTGGAVFGIFAVVVTLGSGLPTMFWALAAAMIAVCVAVLVMLWRRDTTAFLTPRLASSDRATNTR